MPEISFREDRYDRSNPMSIFNYSRHLIGHSLHSLLGEEAVRSVRKGKGSLGQMVEELFFKYDVNSNREADFAEAKLELKCTPLKKSADKISLNIKERLVCSMIDYFEIVDTPFEKSHLLSKCRLMLLLFYLHVSGYRTYDLEFMYRVLWELPEKDFLLIKQDYETIADKVRRGEAHLISEGDTLYLGASRKGQKGESPQPQPNSDIKANRRAFSLKPAYMRHILSHIQKSGQNYFTNYSQESTAGFELVSKSDLKGNSFESIILNRFKPFIGKNYLEICNMLGIEAYQAKSKYADIAGLIASEMKSKRISMAEEFIKSGIVMKTIRLGNKNGTPKEAMSFKNIDYFEVYGNDNWLDSELYELFTNRFMFVVFKPEEGKKISMDNRRTCKRETEQSFVLDNVFFWTMPPEDLKIAREYWLNIRKAVKENKIETSSFWSMSDNRNFHIRPKAQSKNQKAENPNGGECDKYCYWFNPSYIKNIIDGHEKGSI